MICVECSLPIKTLYETYKGDHIRLTICPSCNKVADRYIEFDKVLVFIDLMLLKPQAYKHTIYNQSLNSGAEVKVEHEHDSPEPKHQEKTFIQRYGPCLRLLVLMLLFEVYLTWAYEEKNFIKNVFKTSLMNKTVLENPRIIIQYFFFLTKAVLDTLVLHVSIQFFTYQFLGFGHPTTVEFEESLSPSSSKILSFNDIPRLARSPSSSSSSSNVVVSEKVSYSRDYFISIVSTTILLSNLIKVFPIVMLIWPYDIFILNVTSNLVQIIHLVILIEVLHIVLLENENNQYWKLTLIVLASQTLKFVTTRLILVSVFRFTSNLAFKTAILDELNQLRLKLHLVHELFNYIGL
ncbi:hypothetical protein OGAPHI_004086 [Ogataea philodendri]|uniref:Protein ARV n=1 Tax=Ogataea philodendri TaxID=1378263 RepID=A0A9P8P610_9ASCO|nr:uncharacterized protein OGAPHI_004086 [Ogataea philodendri]KAH3665897.1 hypothetical protein OGAPHI_004086 [Ogataea philodendri]